MNPTLYERRPKFYERPIPDYMNASLAPKSHLYERKVRLGAPPMLGGARPLGAGACAYSTMFPLVPQSILADPVAAVMTGAQRRVMHARGGAGGVRRPSAERAGAALGRTVALRDGVRVAGLALGVALQPDMHPQTIQDVTRHY